MYILYIYTVYLYIYSIPIYIHISMCTYYIYTYVYIHKYNRIIHIYQIISIRSSILTSVSTSQPPDPPNRPDPSH